MTQNRYDMCITDLFGEVFFASISSYFSIGDQRDFTDKKRTR